MFFFDVAPARFVLFRSFLCWRNANLAGRFACGRCCRVSFCCVGFSMFASFLKLRVSILFAHFSTASHSSTISKKFVLRRSYRCFRSKITPGLKKCFKLTCEMTYPSQSLILPHLQDPPQNKFAFSNPSTAKRIQHPAWIRAADTGVPRLVIWLIRLFPVGLVQACEHSTREVLLSEAGFEKAFRTQNWSVGASYFVNDFVLFLGKGCRLLLKPS